MCWVNPTDDYEILEQKLVEPSLCQKCKNRLKQLTGGCVHNIAERSSSHPPYGGGSVCWAWKPIEDK